MIVLAVSLRKEPRGEEGLSTCKLSAFFFFPKYSTIPKKLLWIHPSLFLMSLKGSYIIIGY